MVLVAALTSGCGGAIYAFTANSASSKLETAEALGWLQPLEPALGAQFHRVIGTLVRLVAPRR